MKFDWSYLVDSSEIATSILQVVEHRCRFEAILGPFYDPGELIAAQIKDRAR
jgi:hypothetical protein